jgi:virginiamycin B lyase
MSRFARCAVVALGLMFAVTGALAVAPAADSVNVSFDEWLTPSKPPYPHDPGVAPDGSIWYTGQRANVVGRFDPATQQFKEYALPTANSGPHGVVADKDGNIWYTGNSAGLIGKIDRTGKIVEYRMPDPKARDPHTAAFLANGLMVFTVQAGNFVGTLDPKAPGGAIRLVSPPTPNARPYGIVVNSKGDLAFFDEFNAPKIGRLDPKTLAVKEFALPNANARPRRIAMAKDDTVWYGDYARGYLGHLDPATGKVEEFLSPGGADSRPYAIAVTRDGAVWYCETGDDAKNMLVRFDPTTKKAQAWAIPSGGGTVRNMDVDKSGNLWLAESGVGKIARVTIR